MKLTNDICISFLRGSGWLYNHDKEITISERNKALDDLMAKVSECFISDADWNYLLQESERLKEGAGNGIDNQ